MATLSKQANEILEASTSVKAKVAKFLLSGNSGTLDQLTAKLKAEKVTVQTALSDLKSEKYGIKGVSPLNIARNEEGHYVLANGSKSAAKRKSVKADTKAPKEAKAKKAPKEAKAETKAPAKAKRKAKAKSAE